MQNVEGKFDVRNKVEKYKIFSVSLECKQSKCLSTTPICGVDKGFRYEPVGSGVNLNPQPTNTSNGVGTGDAAGCRAFCRKNYHDAKYFTYFTTDVCRCKTAEWSRVNDTNAESGAIYCDDSGKIVISSSTVFVEGIVLYPVQLEYLSKYNCHVLTF